MDAHESVTPGEHAEQSGELGTLYTSEIDEYSKGLLNEIISGGHTFNVVKTRLEYKSPYIRTAQAEVIGAEAIRKYLKL